MKGNREVIDRLTELHVAVLRTDLDGFVTVSTDGQRLWFNQMAWQESTRNLWYAFQVDLVH